MPVPLPSPEFLGREAAEFRLGVARADDGKEGTHNDDKDQPDQPERVPNMIRLAKYQRRDAQAKRRDPDCDQRHVRGQHWPPPNTARRKHARERAVESAKRAQAAPAETTD